MGETLARADEALTTRHAFRAAQAFLEAWWERGGRQNGEFAVILTSMEPTGSGMPLDQALWNDWLKAIDRTR